MTKIINEYENKTRENEKKFEEFQLINKTLENTLQNKTNEFNQKLNNVQHEFNQVEQKNKVTKLYLYVTAFSFLRFKGFIN
jgi:hypothetical protein